MKYGFVGQETECEFLPRIHEKLSDSDYENIELKKSELVELIRSKDFAGLNIGEEFAGVADKYLSEIDEHAEELGFVDTVINRGGRLYGFNTSFGAFCGLVAHAGIEIKSRNVLVIGAGAVSKVAASACASLGAGKVISVVGFDDAKKHPEAEIVVNASNEEKLGKTLDFSVFKSLCAVLDTASLPLRSRLVFDAEKAKIACEGGLFMLVRQAVLSHEIFTGDKVRYGEAERIYSEILRANENIVLIGMPGCGKSVVGNTVASLLGRRFIDVDNVIEQRYGSVPYVLKEKGEYGFRNIEQRVIADISKQTGIVIAVGGGSVTRRENIDALKANGRLFFIDRSPELISLSNKEPLSSSRLASMALYSQRYSVYRDVADARVDGDESIKDVANSVIMKFRRVGADGKLRVLIINGPNLNLLGIREPDIYGRETYSDLSARINKHAEKLGVKLEIYQSNHEGAIVDKIQQSMGNVDALIINPAGYTHTSIAIPDAIKAVGIPTLEVHLSKVDEREEYRRINYVREACFDTVSGMGGDGYIEALDRLVKKFE
ncbi:MAG: type II 3-dehydroquinate dehydratase [Clostridia bacterium]|nr:type II 3-dehydroquinate dehydratase [Clostridia bacterium]